MPEAEIDHVATPRGQWTPPTSMAEDWERHFEATHHEHTAHLNPGRSIYCLRCRWVSFARDFQQVCRPEEQR